MLTFTNNCQTTNVSILWAMCSPVGSAAMFKYRRIYLSVSCSVYSVSLLWGKRSHAYTPRAWTSPNTATGLSDIHSSILDIYFLYWRSVSACAQWRTSYRPNVFCILTEPFIWMQLCVLILQCFHGIPPIQWVTGNSFLRVTATGAWRWPLIFFAEVSTTPYVFMAWRLSTWIHLP
jgi:hypothetical protein